MYPFLTQAEFQVLVYHLEAVFDPQADKKIRNTDRAAVIF